MLDANGGEKTLSYTRDGQLASYTDCSGKTTLLKYDALGQLSKTVNAAGEATEYHYNAGHLSRLVYPDKTEDRFEHDAEGRLLSYTDALHRRTRWDYNEAGLIRQRHHPNSGTRLCAKRQRGAWHRLRRCSRVNPLLQGKHRDTHNGSIQNPIIAHNIIKRLIYC
nr:RHS repeat domain-containing protein [Pseudomonas monteilii]